MKKAVYSKAFREQALRKVYQRGSRSVRAIAEELSVNYFTLKNWMKETGKEGQKPGNSAERPPRAWTPEERLAALAESYGLEGEALAAWCRQRGVYAHQLSQWRAEFCAGTGRAREDDPVLRQLQEENQRLRRELVRKEKALCEAGALLVLQKKFRALWEAEDA
jgi:transposase-like protein